MNSTEEWLLRPGGLAARLRDLRRDARFTGQTLAATLGWIQPKVSKIENGKQMPSPEDIEAWARACGASDEVIRGLQDMLAEAKVIRRQWRQQVRHGQVAIQQDYDELARQSTHIRNAEVAVIPGLLQTPGYARHQALQSVQLHGADPDEIDETVAARMRRQEILYDASRRFEFVITEAALRMLWCPRADMLSQLDRLIGVTLGPPHVWFGIMPFGVELSTVAQTRFVMFDDDRAIIEDYVDETTYHGEEAAGFAKAMDLLMAESVTGEQARELIVRAMRDLRSTT